MSSEFTPNVQELYPAAIAVLGQLFVHGPTCDGNVLSKAGRGDLVKAGLGPRLGVADGGRRVDGDRVRKEVQDAGLEGEGGLPMTWFEFAIGLAGSVIAGLLAVQEARFIIFLAGVVFG